MRRAFVVSPLPAVRAGLRALITAQQDWAVVGEADRLAGALELAASAAPDVVVLDAEPGAELAPQLGAAGVGPGLVVLGPVPDADRLPAELSGRAWAYVPRDVGPEQLAAALAAVASGMVAIDPALGGRLIASAAPAAPSADGVAEDLTSREREVLQLVALGLPNKTIARRLGISEHTVKFHVASVLAKLGASSRTEAVHLGARRGLVAL